MTVLVVGLDVPSITKTAWECKGLFLTFARSPGEAILILKYGDFDLCVVGNAVSTESKAKFVDAIRSTLRSSIPIIYASGDHSSSDTHDRNCVNHSSATFMAAVDDLLTEARRSSASVMNWQAEQIHEHYRGSNSHQL